MRLCFLLLHAWGMAQTALAQTTYLYSNAKQCDTCLSILLVSHGEGTEYKDFYVDSGIVFVNNHILDTFQSRTDSGFTLGKSQHRFVPKKINTRDLYFTNKSDVEKLWGVTNQPYQWDFSKKYRIRGYVRELKKYSLYFELLGFEQLF